MGTILVATDMSARGDRAVTRAAGLARARKDALRIFCAVDEVADAASTLARIEAVEGALRRVAEGIDGVEVSSACEAGAPAELVPKAAAEAGAALVVLGAHGSRGLAEMVRTPTLVRIVRALDRPALVALGRPEGSYGTVIVGWDFSPAAAEALALAGDFAPDASIIQVTATHEPYYVVGQAVSYATLPEEQHAELEREMREAVPPGLRGRTGDPVVRMGGPGVALLGAVRDGGADLLAVGRHARSGFVRMLLGETSSDMILSAPCDVLVAPPRG
ncbi:nucleotide-binding universal stress UspA family protein [Hasllibacter halocynthiae]|uniref:Nucleotide-binding universal stress UspA family protein n=1 Tax=Hasllibacter halocynthiae TaxID=595589 RepID=A0A2T0X6V9_9RHOB|nr:universal stress protein [Hasllibacter halocynthiae]PRY94657.1 nucleotide-binding universal stress UspA family protein [Hasllibacter halocynthiae]